jgi:hypothetical protein
MGCECRCGWCRSGQMLGELPAVVTHHMIYMPQAEAASCLPQCLNPFGTSQLVQFRASEDIHIPTERYTGLDFISCG